MFKVTFPRGNENVAEKLLSRTYKEFLQISKKNTDQYRSRHRPKGALQKEEIKKVTE